MRALVLLLGIVFFGVVVAQEKPVKPKSEKKADKKQKPKPAAHGKPTPEQIRKFNELQKKQQQEQQKR